MDQAGIPVAQQLEERLWLVEQYDRDGFHAYHLAEHHGTPLGLAPSPNLLLAAIAQRTRRLRFGALVTVLPLYHPIRLIEEIMTLDHLSGGRYQLGVGAAPPPSRRPSIRSIPRPPAPASARCSRSCSRG